MKKKIIFFLLIIFAVSFILASDKDELRVKNVLQNYMNSLHSSNFDGLEKSLHPEFCRISTATFPQTKRSFILKDGLSNWFSAILSKKFTVPEPKRDIKIKVLRINQGMAIARVSSVMFYDYLFLSENNNVWKIVLVLSSHNSKVLKNPEQSENTLISRACMDYIDGAYSGNAERMENAIHPELIKVMPRKDLKKSFSSLFYSNSSLLIEGTRARLGLLAKEKRNINLKIFDQNKDIATVEVISNQYLDYLNLCKINEKWKIVQVIWKPNLKR